MYDSDSEAQDVERVLGPSPGGITLPLALMAAIRILEESSTNWTRLPCSASFTVVKLAGTAVTDGIARVGGQSFVDLFRTTRLSTKASS